MGLIQDYSSKLLPVTWLFLSGVEITFGTTVVLHVTVVSFTASYTLNRGIKNWK